VAPAWGCGAWVDGDVVAGCVDDVVDDWVDDVVDDCVEEVAGDGVVLLLGDAVCWAETGSEQAPKHTAKARRASNVIEETNYPAPTIIARQVPLASTALYSNY
jgi:hypothetical protein